MITDRPQAGSPPVGDPIIRVSGLGKKFKLYPRPRARLAEWLTLGAARRHQEFWALRDVSFELGRGESLGVIGANGSGKSTLLKILSGAMYPTEGTLDVRGRVLSLLELGTGLNGELTGRENVRHSARMLGFDDAYAAARLPAIEAFAEIPDGFFDRPVRLYSSGMLVRLVFSMFVSFDPDIFVVDEALSVGDVFFQQKCVARIEQMLRDGVTVLFVSHDMELVRRLCRRAVLLSHGKVLFSGASEEAVARYFTVVAGGQSSQTGESTRTREHFLPPPVLRGRAGEGALAEGEPTNDETPPLPSPGVPGEGVNPVAAQDAFTHSPSPGNGSPHDEREDLTAHDILRLARSRHGAGRLKLVAASFRDASGNHVFTLRQMETATLTLLIRAEAPIERPSVGIHLFDRLGNLVFAAGTMQLGVSVPRMAAGEERLIRIRITFSVQPGEYTLAIGASESPADATADMGIIEDQCEGIGPIAVHPTEQSPAPFYGIARLPMEVSL